MFKKVQYLMIRFIGLLFRYEINVMKFKGDNGLLSMLWYVIAREKNMFYSK